MHHSSSRVTAIIAWNVFSRIFSLAIGTGILQSERTDLERTRSAERQANGHVESEFQPTDGVSRGPACLLERLPQAVPGLVSDLAISGDIGAREDQFPPAPQAEREPNQVQEGRCRDRARGRS